MKSEIYSPKEDSYLLSETLKKEIPKVLNENKNLRFIEIGSGSGIQLETLKSIGVKNIIGTDINPLAVKKCKSKKFRCIESDLFESIKGKFDVIIFNPPYLPLDKKEPGKSRLSTTGGITGGELINRFLSVAKHYLEKNGKIFLLTSSLTKGIDFSGYETKKISEKSLFFEKLFVWELRLNDSPQ